MVYDSIVQSLSPPIGSSLIDLIWNGTLPKKISCFFWLALSNKLLTWDNLQKRGWIGPSICALCCANVDSAQHLFVHYSVWKNLLTHLSEQHHIAPYTQSDNLMEFLENWVVRFSKHSICCFLPFHTMWVLWKVRNYCLFEGKKMSVLSMIQKVVYFSQMYFPIAEKGKNLEFWDLAQNLIILVVFLMEHQQKIWEALASACT